MGEEAFIYSGVKQANIDVKVIPNGAFAFCEKLEQVIIGPNVIQFSGSPFVWSENIKTVYFATEEQKQKFASHFPADAQLIVQ